MNEALKLIRAMIKSHIQRPHYPAFAAFSYYKNMIYLESIRHNALSY